MRGSPVVSPDETSWKIGGHLQWLWAYATPSTVVYAIQPGRGFPEAAKVLGASFGGVLVRDGWAPYRQFDQALHQTCIAHLLRRSREMITDYPRAAWPRHVQAVLHKVLKCATDATAVRFPSLRRNVLASGTPYSAGVMKQIRT